VIPNKYELSNHTALFLVKGVTRRITSVATMEIVQLHLGIPQPTPFAAESILQSWFDTRMLYLPLFVWESALMVS